MMLLLWAASNGNSIGPAHVASPVRTLYLDFESSKETLADRIGEYEEMAGPMSENMTIWSASASGADMNLTTQEGMEEFTQLVNEIKPQIVVLDTVRQAWLGMEENAPASWVKVNALAMACRNSGSSVVMIHHRNKPGQNGQGREAGSTAQLKDLDTQIFVTKVLRTKEDAEREAAIPNEVTKVMAGNGNVMSSWDYLTAMSPKGCVVKAVFQLTFGKMRSTSENHVTTYIGLTQDFATGKMHVVGTLTPMQKALVLHKNGSDAISISGKLGIPVTQISRWINPQTQV
jgi:hypothetical protein